MWDDDSFESGSFEAGSWLIGLREAVQSYLRAVRLTVRTGITAIATTTKAMTATVRRKSGD